MQMKLAFTCALLTTAALLLAACGNQEKPKGPNTNTASGVNEPSAPAATPDALLALDRQATAAYLKGDSQFFEGMLSDKFTTREAGRQMDKATVVKWIAGNKCDVKDWKLDDPQMAQIAADIYVLSYRGMFDGTCAASGGASKIPSPIRGATVWMRNGSAWQAVFHGQDPIFDAQNPPPPAKAGSKKETKKAGQPAPTASTAADPDTAAMMAVEKSGWEAWKAKDAKKLDELTTANLSFQNIFGVFFSNKADTIKNWTSAYCDITKVGVADGAGTLLSPSVGMLNRTGTAEGTCNGQKVPPAPIYGTSLFVKEGDSWKMAFSLNRLD